MSSASGGCGWWSFEGAAWAVVGWSLVPYVPLFLFRSRFELATTLIQLGVSLYLPFFFFYLCEKIRNNGTRADKYRSSLHKTCTEPP